MVQKRSIPLAILLSLITFGIYYLYWFVCVTNDTNRLGKTKTASGGMAILRAILTCGIYTYYWSYMTGKKMGEIDGSGSGAGLCLILAIFCLGFIVPILAQSTLNNAAEKTANKQENASIEKEWKSA